MMPTRTVEDYLKLPYHIEITHDNDDENPGWVARVVELPGCLTQGDDFTELGDMIQDAMRGWINTALADDIPVPEPALNEDYSGKFVVRVPKSLHRQLAETAEREGVSLNQFINVALAQAVAGRASTPLTYQMPEKQSALALREGKKK